VKKKYCPECDQVADDFELAENGGVCDECAEEREGATGDFTDDWGQS
jgi:hypothetical protein